MARHGFIRSIRFTIRKSGAIPAALLMALSLQTDLYAQPVPPPAPSPAADISAGKPRLFVLTDIGNEPDDQMSFVRLLLYSNEIDIEGLTAVTSTWLRQQTNPQTLHSIIGDYAKVRDNLMRNAPGWPTAAALDALVASGRPAFGMTALQQGELSSGARLLIAAADRDDPRPLWISIWGGANVLAEALREVRATRSPAEVERLVRKLRVYSISDQDDAGPWIRREFPSLIYVVKPSPPDSAEYASATWTGISGDRFYRNGEGADFTTVTNEWLDANIRSKGPLGQRYPKFAFIMEGDTPSWLNLIGNGLESWRDPSWGGWGGRYLWLQPYGETHPIYTQGGGPSPRVDSRDTVTGIDGKPHTSDQATIWRWRDAFQNDFAARMSWTILPPAEANHAPRARIAGQPDTGAITLQVAAGASVALDASTSSDPDGQHLHFHWFVYPEAGFNPGKVMANVEINGDDQARITLHALAACRQGWIASTAPCPGAGIAHVILAVSDDGKPAMTSYRRIIVTVAPGAP